jgi:hypothetical protein
MYKKGAVKNKLYVIKAIHAAMSATVKVVVQQKPHLLDLENKTRIITATAVLYSIGQRVSYTL